MLTNALFLNERVPRVSYYTTCCLAFGLLALLIILSTSVCHHCLHCAFAAFAAHCSLLGTWRSGYH